MARERGRRLDERFPEPDLLPILNIIFMLILAMVSMAAMLPLGVLSSEAQKLARPGAAAAPEEPGKKPLNLIVFITDAGFNVSVRGEVKMGAQDPANANRKLPLIPKIDSPDGPGYDYLGLKHKLLEFKKLDQEEQAMTLTADPEVKFDVVIQTMDASRYGEEKHVLFPKVSFAAGIVG
jgi:biopolymer transport protein ExbD